MSQIKLKLLLFFIAVVVMKMNGFSGGSPAGANVCAAAISLSGASSGSTCTNYTLAGSTITGDPLATCNTTTENTSTWYSFVANATNMTVMGDNAATSGVSCSHSVAVYSGSCGSLTQIGCSFGFDAVSVIGTTFVVGQTYFVQISYAAGGPCGDLDVCAYVCPTAPNDACSGAVAIDGTADPSSNTCTTPGPTTNTPTITPAMLCAGTLENTAWYSFTVLNSANVVITLSGITCTGGGAGFQIGYFTGACGSLTNFGCNSGSGGTVTTTMTGLTAGQVVTIAIDGNAGAECTYSISATNTIIALPIELLFFDAKYVNNVVQLNWTTATELNNDFFTVEKTTDGTNYSTVAVLQSASSGNSTNALSYSSLDRNPESGLIYYRLKQTDFNGDFKYSNLVKIVIENEEDLFYIKPNPTSQIAELSFRCRADEKATLTIYDYNGRLIFSEEVYCPKGQNTTEINLNDQPDGMYFITMTSGNRLYKTKLIKKIN